MQHASVALLDADPAMAEKVITGDAALARGRPSARNNCWRRRIFALS